MAFADELSAMIGRIYDTAEAGDGWDELAAEMLRLMGGRWMLASVLDLRLGNFARSKIYGLETPAAERGLQEYLDGMHQFDATLLLANREPHRRWIDSEAAFGAENYLQNEYIRWNLSRFGSTHWTIGFTGPDDGISLGLSLHPDAEQGRPGKRQVRVFRTLFDHFDRATRLGARRPDPAASPNAMIVLNHQGGIKEMNDAARAILAARDGIESRAGKLKAVTSQDASPLDRLLRGALAEFQTRAASGALPIRRPSGRSWIVKITPVPSGVFPFGLKLPGALVTLTDPDAVVITPAQRQAFGLTARETELAEKLVNGSTLEEAAAQLGISPNTARVHLRSLFAKTGTNRQVDLVRVLLVTV